MNTYSRNSHQEPERDCPGFICRIVRSWYPDFDEHRQSSAFRVLAARHIGHCSACQKHFDAAADIDKTLRREAHRRTVAPSAGLEAQILAAVLPVTSSARTRTSEHRRISTGWWMIAAGTVGAAAAAIAVLVTLRQPSGSENVAQVDPSPTPAMSEQAFATLENLPGRVWEEIAPRAAQVAGEDPLGREMAAVRSDTRSALRFLAMNFLPAETVEQIVPGVPVDDSST